MLSLASANSSEPADKMITVSSGGGTDAALPGSHSQLGFDTCMSAGGIRDSGSCSHVQVEEEEMLLWLKNKPTFFLEGTRR